MNKGQMDVHMFCSSHDCGINEADARVLRKVTDG